MSQILHGYPLSHWESRKRYWIDKRNLWMSLESDAINFDHYNVPKDDRYFNEKKSRKKQLKKKNIEERGKLDAYELNNTT